MRGTGTLNATGGNAGGDSCGVFANSNITISGGTLNATGGNASGSCGVFADSIAVSGGTLNATGAGGNVPGSLGMAANSITLTGGTTTAIGNRRAVDWPPSFGTPPANTWYMWKEHIGNTSDPGGAYNISSGTNQFSHYRTAQYLKVTPIRYATASNVTVDGTAGTAITDTDVTLTLTGETFKGLSANADVSSWFTNRPTNLSAKIKTAVTAGAASATVTLYGTPATASTAAMAITIPATALTGGTAITVTANADAKYNIAASPAAPTITTQPLNKTVTEGSISDSDTLTVVATTGTGTLSYLWYQCSDTSKSNASAIDSANAASFKLPSGLTADTYYYFCKVTANNLSVDSRVATVTVNAPAPAPITIPTTVSPGPTFVSGSAPELTVTVGDGLLDFNAEGNYDGIDSSSDLQPRLGTVGAPGADGKVENGSIVITLKQSYLNTLAPGTYRLRVKLKGGAQYPAYVETRIVVRAPGNVPKTGDSAMPGLWAGVILLAGIGLAASALRRRRHSN